MVNPIRIAAVCLLLSSTAFCAFAQDTLHLQLRWYHQFQFAGYYMAKEKGFYEDAGLDISIHQAIPGQTNPIHHVLNGQSDFAVENSSVIIQYLEGKPLVALAAITQTSPLVWISLKSSNIRIVQDLAGHSLMTLPEPAHSEFLALLKKEGIPFDKVNILPSSFDINDLINGKTDVFYGYLSNEPYFLQQQGIEYHLIKPREYGINFYSDVLFTHAELANNNPKLVQAFLNASLQGWRYAMNHVEETVDIILEKYDTNKTRDHLLYEAEILKESIMPELVEIGHMNPGRWQFIADTYRELGVTDGSVPVEEFIFNYDKSPNYVLLVSITSVFLILLLLASLVIIRFKRLSQALQQTNAELASIAISDPLTGVMNRRGFIENAERLISLSQRHHKTACLLILDIDYFKKINDQHGHKVGDFCLIEFCEVIQSCCRSHDLIARIGGEEFIILLNDCASALAKEKANYLIKRVCEHEFKPNGIAEPIHITVSIGIAEINQSLQQAWQYADEALYKVKNSGRNGVQIHLPQK